MRLVVFGLTMSSSWGNGHATLWRGLCRALGRGGHHVTFFERDVPYYAERRDLKALEQGELVVYPSFDDVKPRAEIALENADAAMITSYCPDGRAASDLVLDAHRAVRVFYDLDAPITLDRTDRGESVEYLPEDGLADFDLVLSFTGGRALTELVDKLGARRVAPLFGSVDPDVHCPVEPRPEFRGNLSYLGTHASDRQVGFEQLFLEPARQSPDRRFVLGGAQYKFDFSSIQNLVHFTHVAPPEHASFFASSDFTLNVTRETMARFGVCPSGRLFEAAASGAPIISDWFEGLDGFFRPNSEIVIARSTDEVLSALRMDERERSKLARRARERTLDEHTATHRARELVAILESVRR